MPEVRGFTITSLRAKLDQDVARLREARKLLEIFTEKESVSKKYETLAYYGAFTAFATVPLSLLFPDLPWSYLNAAIVTFILANFLIAWKTTRSVRSSLKKFVNEEKTYNYNTWGSEVHPAILLLWDDDLEYCEVHVHRDGERFVAGTITDSDSILESVKELEVAESEDCIHLNEDGELDHP